MGFGLKDGYDKDPTQERLFFVSDLADSSDYFELRGHGISATTSDGDVAGHVTKIMHNILLRVDKMSVVIFSAIYKEVDTLLQVNIT